MKQKYVFCTLTPKSNRGNPDFLLKFQKYPLKNTSTAKILKQLYDYRHKNKGGKLYKVHFYTIYPLLKRI